MAYCSKCGTENPDGAVVCSNCGTPQQIQPSITPQAAPVQEDKGGFLWGLLGCCIPIVGLILFLVWKDSKPKTAKAAGIGALISVAIGIIYYIVIIAFAASSVAYF